MEPFAYIDDLESGWRSITPEESLIAEELLERASMKLRGSVRIDETDEVQSYNLRTVTCDMVRRALSERGDAFGLAQEAETYSWSSSNPAGNLEPTKRELNLLRSGQGTCTIGL